MFIEKENYFYIEEFEKDKREYEEMISRVKSLTFKPKVSLKLYPEFSCFMVDCVRHKFK